MRQPSGTRPPSRHDVAFLAQLARRTGEHVSALLGTQSTSALERGVALLGSDDVVLARLPTAGGAAISLAYVATLVSPWEIEEKILAPLKDRPGRLARLPGTRPVGGARAVASSLLQGRAVIQDGERLVSLAVSHARSRSIDEPTTERAVFGAKDAFIELLDANVALVRQHARDPDLRVELLHVGTRVPTRVAVLSIAGVADPDHHAMVVRRIEAHPVARLPFVSHLVTPLFGPVWSPFLPVSFTERPGRVLDHLYRGRIAVLADGSPFALIAPMTWLDDVREEEVHLLSPLTRLFVRTLRLAAIFLATVLPGLYVAILTGNPNFLPGLLSVTIAASRESVPYPLITETFFMMLVLDVLAESTVAMKGVLGPSISIVGSLIIGDAAVRANLVSNLSVILVAGTALGTFVTPHFWSTYGYRMWKYPILLASGALGVIGWATSVTWLIVHLASSRTLGVAYGTAAGSGGGKLAGEVLRAHPVGSTLPDPAPRR